MPRRAPGGAGMNVYLSFDVEVWCNGWDALDARFPASFDRYVYGRSKAGDYALPKTLEIIAGHGLTGVFFVEPLFSARFGAAHLRTITELILAARQDVQLHLHPEWTDEIRPRLIADADRKRQHLPYYTLAEQTALIGHARALLEAAKGAPVTAFRAGSFAANRDTYRALAANALRVDSSLNEVHDHSGGSLPGGRPDRWPRSIDGVESYPVTVFRDGFGRLRPAHVGACSFLEMREALRDAQAAGCRHFVIVSHNFEMLKPGTATPDAIVVSRFERLCEFLARHPELFRVGPYPLQVDPAGADAVAANGRSDVAAVRPRVSARATAVRHLQQLARRVF